MESKSTKSSTSKKISITACGSETVISFLKKRLKKTTNFSLIYKLFRKKKVLINGNPTRYYQYKLKEGDVVEINDVEVQYIPASLGKKPKKSNFDVEIVYEDENVCIVSKPHGCSMPDLDRFVRNYLFEKDEQEYTKKIKEHFIFSPVHRLDKMTKGLVIYPKVQSSKKELYKAISDKQRIIKEYIVLAEMQGRRRNIPAEVSGFIRKNEMDKKMIFQEKSFLSDDEKSVSMKVEKVDQLDKFVLLKVILYTGRKHQIRSALSYYGFPVIGDKKYGSSAVFEGENKIMLFANKLTFLSLGSNLSYLNGKEVELDGKIRSVKDFFDKITNN